MLICLFSFSTFEIAFIIAIKRECIPSYSVVDMNYPETNSEVIEVLFKHTSVSNMCKVNNHMLHCIIYQRETGQSLLAIR